MLFLLAKKKVEIFDPLSIAGLEAWWDCSDSMTTTPTKVSAIADKSGNGHTLTNGTDITRPLASTLNGLQSADFASAGRFMTCTAFAQADCTIFVAGNFGTPTANNSYLLNTSTATLSARPTLTWQASLGNAYGVWDGLANIGNENLYLADGNTVGYYKLTHSFDQPSTQYAKFGNNPNDFNAIAVNSFYLSENWTGLGRSSASPVMNFGELLMYNSLLSDADANKVANYLKTKWGGAWLDLGA
jgi:hypothetical protein